MTLLEKRLLTVQDMELWKESATYHELLAFIEKLAHSVAGCENNQYTLPISDNVEKTCKILDEIVAIFDSHPVLKDKETTRFGKLEFRDFYDEIGEKGKQLISKEFVTLSSDQVEELSVYLLNSFGDRQRIDYGSGHELNFLCFLFGLYRLNVLTENDYTNTVLKIFISYLHLMRLLEKEYWLEPAGSHGVWGLDDYHFLPFLFGAFQLSTHKHLKPKSIHNEEVVEMFANRYLYFGCIAFINGVKTTASLRWHSPMLDDISGVKSWSKVSEGMIKMYKAEVLGKLPIMQHFFFGTFLKCPDGVSPPGTHEDHDHGNCTHSELHNTWGDCCGIKVPSAIAATEANKMQSEKHNNLNHAKVNKQVKRLPFD
ncbi:Serine/threonine-protein phosphatase 2A activator 2 [Hanseniaspora vineae]